jgi:hypothetical protein
VQKQYGIVGILMSELVKRPKDKHIKMMLFRVKQHFFVSIAIRAWRSYKIAVDVRCPPAITQYHLFHALNLVFGNVWIILYGSAAVNCNTHRSSSWGHCT